MSSRVLIVEPEPQYLRLIVGAAEQAGFRREEMVCTSSDREAGQAAGQERFDLAVVDLSLGANGGPRPGIDLVQQLATLLPDCRIVGC